MIAIDAETRSVLDWLRKHSAGGKPALFTIAATDARRIVALVDALLEAPVLQIMPPEGVDLDALRAMITNPRITIEPKSDEARILDPMALYRGPIEPPPVLLLAKGAELDVYGRVYGLPRLLNEADDVYRERLRLLITKGPGYATREAQEAAIDNGYHPKHTHGRDQEMRAGEDGTAMFDTVMHATRWPAGMRTRPAHGGYVGRARLAGKSDGWGADAWRRYRKA